MADTYVCQLTEASLKKAKEELNEDPRERLGAVETLRKWVLEQPHLKCPTDTAFLLRFLRFTHFSQLEARKVLDKFFTSMTKEPSWMTSLDTSEKEVQLVLSSGYITVLPSCTDEGRTVLICRPCDLDLKGKKYGKKAVIRMILITTNYMLLKDENIQVNGFEYIMDLTDISMGYMHYFGLDTLQRLMGIWTGAVPTRQKVFHHYNGGPVFDAIWALIKSFFPKKLNDRIILHSTLETLYKKLPMRILPREYLPDDYAGPCDGTLQEMREKFLAEFTRAEYKKKILEETDKKWGVVESKRPSDIPQASFRKLNID